MPGKRLLRQLFDATSSTYSYLLADESSREAVMIDPVYEQHERDRSLLRELDLKLLASIDTHCHADHVTGSWLMKHSVGSQILASAHAGIEGLDRSLAQGDRVHYGECFLEVLETPGHTNGCISLVADDKSMVFTGDCLLIRGCGRTDFQRGSAEKLYHSIARKLFTLPDDCIVYPAHDYSGRTTSTIGEEKKFNPRIGGAANEQDFVGYMKNMHLPHPKQIDIAVPANLKAGRPPNEKIPQPPGWAPVVTTYSGDWQISPQWVAANREKVHILDVRSDLEAREEPVHVANTQRLPIDELRERIDEVPRDKPVVTLCRSGKRSQLAAQQLRKAGWDKVANIEGGVLQWRAEGLPTETT